MKTDNKPWLKFVASTILATTTFLAHAQSNIVNQYDLHDLSHIVPVFMPLNGDRTKSDLSKPWADSRPVAGSGGMLGVRTPKRKMTTRHGYLQWGYTYLEEHYSTHVDSTDHFITTDDNMKNVSAPDERGMSEIPLNELVGAIVYIDISGRVEKELAKNNGIPSIDLEKTNFDDTTGINVTAADIDAIAEHLVDGTYIVVNTGWEKFYFGAPAADGDNWKHPYNNNLNHPGVSREATDRLIEIEEKRGIRIAGIVTDNIGVESGHSLRGDQGTDKVDMTQLVMYMHSAGLQRGWKLVENAANLHVLGNYQPGDCDLIIGAPKVAGASGTPSRLIAMCKPKAQSVAQN
jgi:kynurenine formamidase